MRINLFGGPGSGKSTTAAREFAAMKELHYSIEHVNEYVKSWTYIGRVPEGYDQIYLFGKQQQYEYRFLSKGVKNIITDSPTFLSACYAKKYMGDEIAEVILKLCEIYDRDHPFVNIFLRRGDKPYHQDGRFQDKTQASEMDELIYNMLLERYGKHGFIEFDYSDKEGINEYIQSVIEK